jgi:hypothetical protein
MNAVQSVLRAPSSSSWVVPRDVFAPVDIGGGAHLGRRRGWRGERGREAARRGEPSAGGYDVRVDPPHHHPPPIEEQRRTLSIEFLSIALPAFVQLAAEPLAGLVDTASLGRLEPEVLRGAEVALSAQYAVGMLYNDPLLRTSISLAASEDGRRRKNGESGGVVVGNDDDDHEDGDRRALSMAVSSMMLLALAVGTTYSLGWAHLRFRARSQLSKL